MPPTPLPPLFLAFGRHGPAARSALTKLLRCIPGARCLTARESPEPKQRTVSWRLEEAASGPKPAVPGPSDNGSSWMTSSMDLVTGVEVVETDDPPPKGVGARARPQARS